MYGGTKEFSKDLKETMKILNIFCMQVILLQLMVIGPDPADSKKALLRKLIQVNDYTYCYEETRVTPTEKNPTVHT